MCSHLVVLCGDNVIAVNLDSSEHGEGLRECHPVDRYLLRVYICQMPVWEMSEPLLLYLDDIRIGNHQASSGCRINVP